MPEISVRGLEMPESPIRKLAPLAAAAKKRGTKVYHLNIGQPDLPTPQVALDALKKIDRSILEYSPSQGYLEYREKLVGYYAKYNINVTADDIIITSGGSEAVLFAFMSCLNPGDEIIVPEPAYANYMAFAISAGAKIRTIATTIDAAEVDGWTPDEGKSVNAFYTTGGIRRHQLQKGFNIIRYSDGTSKKVVVK
jgi:aspartate aminotransferase